MTKGWMNRASDHGKAVPAGAFLLWFRARHDQKCPPGFAGFRRIIPVIYVAATPSV